jgi:methyl-accepting chemotaxis protein
MNSTPEPHIIDRIGAALPESIRADYFREVNHCRSLPENDEMLRILRVMLILTLLMETVPNRIVAEREGMESLFRTYLPQLQEMLASVHKYHGQLDQRLKTLPERVAAGLNPDAVAACINERLRQQFAQSTIPQSAQALTQAAAEIKTAAGTFSQNAGKLGDAYRGAAEDARNAIDRMGSAIQRSAESARQATEMMTITFDSYCRWAVFVFFALFFVLGAALGIAVYRQMRPPDRIVIRDIPDPFQPVQPQDLHPATRPKPRPKP